ALQTYIQASLLNSNSSSFVRVPCVIGFNLATNSTSFLLVYSIFPFSEYAASPMTLFTSIQASLLFSFNVSNFFPSFFSPLLTVSALLFLSFFQSFFLILFHHFSHQ